MNANRMQKSDAICWEDECMTGLMAQINSQVTVGQADEGLMASGILHAFAYESPMGYKDSLKTCILEKNQH